MSTTPPPISSTDNGARRFDETRTADGDLRPGWAFVLNHLAALGDDGMAFRRAEIERQLRANGVGFNRAPEPTAPGTTATSADEARPWPLDLVPMLIEPEDWTTLHAGIEQRNRLMQAILADIYGDQQLLADRILPPSLVYSHPGYLRDAVGVEACQHMPLYGVDVSRSPSGDWYAADDLAEFPEGLGYALENRLVLARVLPKLFREGRVHRLVSYFRAVQSLVNDSIDRDARCVLLGRGERDPNHFEVTWLAKYLGYTLVELDDLTVRGNRVMLRTVSGLQRIDVILRFLPDAMLDPLTSDANGSRGLPGLMNAVREGTVKVLNPPGSGILGNSALNAYLPSLSEHLLGEPLKLVGAPTYWLGDRDQNAHVQSRFNTLLFRDVRTHGALIDPELLDAQAHARLQADIQRQPQRFVAQERIDRSVVPVQGIDNVHENQITVRLHAVNSSRNGSTEVLKGGLAILDNDRGGGRQRFDDLDGSKDVWVLSDEPVRQDTLLTSVTANIDYALTEGELPSRVAENLFWFGRNAERVEFTARLLRVVITELRDEQFPSNDQDPSTSLAAVLRATTVATGTLPGFTGRGGQQRLRRPDKELNALFTDTTRIGSLPSSLRQLDFSARTVRERISPEQLLILNDLDALTQQFEHTTAPDARDAETLNTRAELLDDLLGRLSAMSGLMHENLTHGEGWHFMMLGKRVARAALGARALQNLTEHGRDDSRTLESALRLFDSVMTYRSRYRSRIEPHYTVHLLVLDEGNPRSLAYQFQQIDEIVAMLPGNSGTHRPSNALSRLAAAGLSRVRLADATSLLGSERSQRQTITRFLGVLESIPDKLSDELTARYFTHVEARSDFGTGPAIRVEAS